MLYVALLKDLHPNGLLEVWEAFYQSINGLRRNVTVGKKHRSRINSPKKNNHIPAEAIIAEQEAHGKEYRANNRKNKQ